MKSLRYGQRADIRDRIIAILSDGKQWHIRDLKKELSWDKTTNVTKVLNEIKMHFVLTKDPRRLEKTKFDNNRKGSLWRLTTK